MQKFLVFTYFSLFLVLSTLPSLALAENLSTNPPAHEETEKPKAWYEKYSIRGYAQLRYNRLFATNPNLVSDQGDKSIGDKNGLLLRRARLIFSGDVNKYMYIYIQPDFASSPAAGTLHFLQIRDFYADIYLVESKEFRFRVGQSKVPFGFENMQSSQNRLPFDRADAVNTAVKDERDLGVFFYWTPTEIRKRFKHLVDSGLKGSGDYGVVGLGLYNGQTANKPEANNSFHYVLRGTYPIELFDSQILELSLQGYTGIYTVTHATGVSTGATDFNDWRVAGSAILYPQPLGVQVEYVFGRGPELNDTQTAVQEASLEGGYVLVNYKLGSFIPYARWQFYRGGKKHEASSPVQRIYETELGVEWQIMPALELTAAYSFMDRNTIVKPYKNEEGRLARLQLQWNY